MKDFNNLGLCEETLLSITKKGFVSPTPVQKKVIPLIINKKCDLIGHAQTGTGKTGAFGIPLIDQLKPKKYTQAIILTPTRELAVQVCSEIDSLKGSNSLSILPIYGGKSIDNQLRSLKKGIDIVVGTPGRILDHLKRKSLNLKKIEYFILDEADEMLNMGFIEDINSILEQTNKSKRTFLFSATIPSEIKKIINKYMSDYETISIKKSKENEAKIDHQYLLVNPRNKFTALCRLIDKEENFYGFIFCRTKREVENVTEQLISHKYRVDNIYGDISQNLREKILLKFRKKMVSILVATDVAARGIDVENLSHVINYHLPQQLESYVHRVGRTGRAGKEGVAITLITKSELKKISRLEKIINTKLKPAKLPTAEDLIVLKKKEVSANIDASIKKSIPTEYADFTKELLQNNSPDNIIASLLQSFYGKKILKSSYKDDSFSQSDNSQRLFVNKGKSAGLSKTSIVSKIQEKVSIQSGDFYDICILESFSFITVPLPKSKQILSMFKRGKKRSDLSITKAKSTN